MNEQENVNQAAKYPPFMKGNGLGREILQDSGGSNRFARKNCFFSPVQCSFFYKRNTLI